LTIVQSQLLYVGELTGTVVTSARLFALPRGQPVILIQATQGVSFAMIGHSSSARASWVGIVPAAGEGRRLALGGYPKELMPIVFRRDGDDRIVPELVIERCLRALASTGVDVIVVVVNDSKLEILRQLREDAHNQTYKRKLTMVEQLMELAADGISGTTLAALPATVSFSGARDATLAVAEELEQGIARGGGGKAAELAPSSPKVLIQLSHTLVKLDKYAEAVGVQRRIAELDPGEQYSACRRCCSRARRCWSAHW